MDKKPMDKPPADKMPMMKCASCGAEMPTAKEMAAHQAIRGH